MRSLDHAWLADALLAGVLAAGRIEMRHYSAGVAVESKADASPVTAADREAEEVLLEALARAAPGVPVVAEERAAEGLVPVTGDAFFLVDPLDGTREFIEHCGEFTINIGLVIGQRPAFGIVYAPALEMLYATAGASRAVEARVSPGAQVRGLADCIRSDIRSREPDVGALVAIESRSHRNEATEAFLAGYPIADSSRSGSSLKFCIIARGDADLYPRLGETSEWDTAAGHAILEAAGGTVTTLDEAPLCYGKADRGFLNPPFVAWGRRPLPARS